MKMQLTSRRPDSLSTPNYLKSKDEIGVSTKRAPWYMSILCRCGIHQGRWLYVTEGKCQQLRLCRFCGKTDMRMKHIRSWRYIKNDVCEQTKICARCQFSQGQRIEHQWGPVWQSGSWFGTKESHRCERCGEVETWVASAGG